MPHLEQVMIASTLRLSDRFLIGIIEGCLGVTHILPCGSSWRKGKTGRITLRNLDAVLIADKERARKLRTLVLDYQPVDKECTMPLSALRGEMAIVYGPFDSPPPT